MSLTFRDATRADVPAIIALLRDDQFGRTRETSEMDHYLAAFDQLSGETGNTVVVGELGGRIVATFQIAFLSGLSLRATRRAQIESVRVAADLRGQGIGRAMMAEAEARARDAGCGLLQLTTHAERNRARDFYEGLDYSPSHVGFKREL
ncbi:MAG: GNAT family N-acetyltransferase [Pseudomonadota bacterium]